MNPKILGTPEGTGDLLFADCQAVTRVRQTLSDLFERRGFARVMTPTLEFYDLFAQFPSFRAEEMYTLTDRRGRLMVLRPDCTLPIARMVLARLTDARRPLRLFYESQVFSAPRQLSGKTNAACQSGIELVGDSSRRSDLEMLATSLLALQGFGLPFRLEIGHVGIFRRLIARLTQDADEVEEIRCLIARKDYAALGDRLDRFGDSSAIRALKQLPRLFGGLEVFEAAAALPDRDPALIRILEELRFLYDNLCALGFEKQVLLDLGMVQQNAYYTGVVFGGYLEGIGDKVLSGGRYDDLYAAFGKPEPAIGFAVNIDPVARRLADRNRDGLDRENATLVFAPPGLEQAALLLMQEQTGHLVLSLETVEQQAVEEAREGGFAHLTVVEENGVRQVF